MKSRYGSWDVYDRGNGSHPVTGRFYALRHGVRIGASTEEALRLMIDQKAMIERDLRRLIERRDAER